MFFWQSQKNVEKNMKESLSSIQENLRRNINPFRKWDLEIRDLRRAVGRDKWTLPNRKSLYLLSFYYTKQKEDFRGYKKNRMIKDSVDLEL